MENKVVLVTHIDLDGIGNVILAKEFKLKIDNYIFVDYSELEKEDFYDRLNSFTTIYITDLAVTESLYEKLVKSKKIFYIFDHHDITKEIYQIDSERVYFDLNKSGTKIFLEYLSKDRRIIRGVKEFVELVDTYDMWKTESELWKKAKALNGVLYYSLNYYAEGYEKYSSFIRNQITKFEVRKDEFYFSKNEKFLIEKSLLKEKEEIEKAFKNIQTRTDSRGKTFSIFRARSKISNTASYFLTKYPKLDYIVCVNTYGGYTGKVSVRSSKDNIDVNDFKNIGGHAQAGGGNFTTEEVKKLLTGEIKSLEYDE